MNQTKRSFVKAGAILSILASVFAIMCGFGLFAAGLVLDKNFVIDIFSVEAEFNLTTNEDGSYFIQYKDFGDLESDIDDEIITIQGEEIDNITTIAKVIVIVISSLMVAISIAEFIIALLILTQLNKQKVKSGLIITLLVLSVLTGNMLTMAFMIVSLCIKEKPVTLNDISPAIQQEQ